MYNNYHYNFSHKESYDLSKTVNIPIELYKSLQGIYFIGYVDDLFFGNHTSAWGMLYNPPNSETPNTKASGRIAFGWWEEKIK